MELNFYRNKKIIAVFSDLVMWLIIHKNDKYFIYLRITQKIFFDNFSSLNNKLVKNVEISQSSKNFHPKIYNRILTLGIINLYFPFDNSFPNFQQKWQLEDDKNLNASNYYAGKKRVKLAVRHGQNANNTLLASGMTRSAVGSSLEIRYFFGRQARLFYEWIARQRMRDCAMLLHSIAITNRYKGFVTMYFRSLRIFLFRPFVLSWILFENEFRCVD